MSSSTVSHPVPDSQLDAPAPDAAAALDAARNARRLAMAALQHASAEFLLLADSYQSDHMISHMLARRAECDAAADALELTGGAS